MKRILFILILLQVNSVFAQKDTLRLYYSGLAVKLLDSNEVKIGKWANTLKGKHVDVEIHAYYDKGEFKQYAEQRLADVELVVIRKARDFITIKYNGPTKSSKSRRSYVDIVYTGSGNISTAIPATEDKNIEKEGNTENKVKEKDSKNDNELKSSTKTENTKKVSESKVDNDYRYDTTYVNGVMKIKKIKIKK